jgi:hypothetical protein
MKYFLSIVVFTLLFFRMQAGELPGGATSLAATKSKPKNAAIKIDLFSPVVGTSAVSFERSIKQFNSIELGIGLIGVGFLESNKDGYYVKAGYKFINKPNTKSALSSQRELLCGSYVKPSIVFHNYFVNDEFTRYLNITQQGGLYSYDESIQQIKREYTGTALLIQFGNQWCFENTIIFDLFGSIGLAKVQSRVASEYRAVIRSSSQIMPFNLNKNTPSFIEEDAYLFGNGFTSQHTGNISLGVNFGFRLGFLIGGS